MPSSADAIETTQLIGSQAIVLRLPRRPDAVLADVALSGSLSDSDPYWGFLWPSANVLAELILAREWPRRLKTIELGCGSGLVGIAALFAGLDVTFSDLVPEAVELARQNAVANGFAKTNAIVLDWRQPLTERFELILASDVLYFSELHQPLIELIDRMLEPSGQCWIADPGRTLAREFLHALSEAGMSYSLRDAEGNEVLMPLPGRFVLIVVKRSQ